MTRQSIKTFLEDHCKFDGIADQLDENDEFYCILARDPFSNTTLGFTPNMSRVDIVQKIVRSRNEFVEGLRKKAMKRTNWQ